MAKIGLGIDRVRIEHIEAAFGRNGFRLTSSKSGPISAKVGPRWAAERVSLERLLSNVAHRMGT